MSTAKSDPTVENGHAVKPATAKKHVDTPDAFGLDVALSTAVANARRMPRRRCHQGR